MKNIPNILTILRIFLSIGLLFTKPYTSDFYIICIIAEITDVLDGYIARKINVVSKFGALLDTVSDSIMVVVLFIILLPVIKIPPTIIIWIIIIAIIRAIGIVIALKKYHAFVILHSYSNRVAGGALFLIIMFYPFINPEIFMNITCFLATIAGIEEILIHIKSDKLNRDRRSIIDL